MNLAFYCINCEYSESRGISPEQTETGDGPKENNRKGSPEQKEIKPHGKVSHPDDEETTNNGEEQPREKHGQKEKTNGQRACPSSTAVHRPN